MHRTLIDNGIASMEKVESLIVAPGATAIFEAGGLHLMMVSNTQATAVGNSFQVSVHLANREHIAFEMQVTTATASAESASVPMPSHHHHHD
jgi:copper(I)-binding protein